MTTKTLLYQIDSFFTAHACSSLNDRKSNSFDMLVNILFRQNELPSVKPILPFLQKNISCNKTQLSGTYDQAVSSFSFTEGTVKGFQINTKGFYNNYSFRSKTDNH